ncbi:VOC family protein [Pseudonocardia acaciae]|uniref:VOC family protein n=1 Tax=Pseudonocardia acaciae TaxID=551276 RepID=UPI00048F923F|nr:VOC family protein [Pseudonocardia acaciae]
MSEDAVATIPLIADAGGRPGQVAMVVADLDEAMASWGAVGHTAPRWRIWTYGPGTVSSLTYRGRPASYSMRLALAGSNPQLELIEPLEPPTIYHDWLLDDRRGVHHLGFHVVDLRATTDRMVDAGYSMIQSGVGIGADGSGGYAYFDTVDTLGYFLEAIEVPDVRRDPERVWPLT